MSVRKERRGLSSVIGAIFMIIVMAAGLNVALWTMQQQDRVTEAVVEKTNSSLDKLNEEIEISDIRVTGNRLNMTVANTGGSAASLKSVYIVNETAKMQYRYDVDLTVDGRNSVQIDTLPLIVMNDTDYSIKVVTESGNSATSTITSLSKVALPMSLYIIPPTITPGENVTVLYTVTNNLTESSLDRAVTLNLTYAIGCTLGSGSCTVTKHVQPPSNTTVITKGNTALFKWVFEIKAPDETNFSFNATLVNAKEGNYAREQGLVKVIDSAQTSFSSEIIVSSTLVQKPEIFLLLPSPFGDSGDRGVFGVNVANPTTTTMEVSRIVVNMYSSKVTGGGGIEMVEDGCPNTPIYPASGWSCPHSNMLEWKNVASPQQIPDLEAISFLVKVKPDDLTDSEPAFMVSVAVFTNMGQFTKTGYSSGMDSGTASLGNVYLTDAAETAIWGNQTMTAGQQVTLRIAMADLDTSASTKIKIGTELIINVPRGFTNVAVQQPQSGFGTITVTPYTDGSTQIVAPLSEELGDVNTAEINVLTFTATAPAAPDPPAKRIYIMHTLIDGETTSNFSAGALAELALLVRP